MSETRSIVLDQLVLKHGSHRNPDDGLCLLEAAAYLAGEPHTDHPRCVSPVLASFGIAINDAWNDNQRQALRAILPKLLNTAGGPKADLARSYLALDWLWRTYVPTFFDLVPGLVDQAHALRLMPEITAAWDAAWDGAWDGAGAAAGAAARDAAGAAARAAAWDAAWDAARDAAGAALQPAVQTLQASALELFTRMAEYRS
jgi:hypothetical protein